MKGGRDYGETKKALISGRLPISGADAVGLFANKCRSEGKHPYRIFLEEKEAASFFSVAAKGFINASPQGRSQINSNLLFLDRPKLFIRLRTSQSLFSALSRSAYSCLIYILSFSLADPAELGKRERWTPPHLSSLQIGF
jgi:hypothetical protein